MGDLSSRGEPIVFDHLASIAGEERQMVVYDRPISLRLLYEEPASGLEHYLVRYPAGVHAQWHRHTAAHTIVVLEGRLEVNGKEIGPGSYCHYPPGLPMRHQPASGGPCLFLNLFHGPADVEVLGDEPPGV
jgi:quercetin dioxygenase-like cupin family protein